MSTFKKALLGAILIGAGTLGSADAALLVNSIPGGAPTLSGVTRENFDALALGTAGGTLASGVTVNFTPSAQAVIGSVPGLFAAPFLSGNNGDGFGPGGTDQPNGPDTTVYLTAGSNAAPTPGAQVEILLPSLSAYVGLLWGSVDDYNTLQFFNGAALVGTITGVNVIASPVGSQGPDGTTYVNIVSNSASTNFDRLVFTSSQFAFEFDNLAFSASIPVPAPAGLALLGLGLVGLGLARRRG